MSGGCRPPTSTAGTPPCPRAPAKRWRVLYYNIVSATGPRGTVRLRGMETGISEASKRVSIFSFDTQGGKQVSFYFRQRNRVQAREAQIRFPAG